jgi:anti-sigma B factor antagonist
LSNIGIKQRRVGSVTILDTDAQLRIGLKFGASGFSLTNAVGSLLEERQNQILLNLEGITTFDAESLGELVSTYLVVNKDGGQFKIFNLTQTLRDLLISTRLMSVFEVYENELQALKSFQGSPHETDE